VPDRIDLDERLAGGRDTLLGDIEAPPLAHIGARAARIRGRRRARAGAVAAGLAVVAVVTLVRPDGGADTPVADPPPGRAPVFTGAGLTINGVPDLSDAVDLPGHVAAVEFTDPEHAFAVSACELPGADPAPCAAGFARSTDGGRTWRTGELPAVVVEPAERPRLAAFDADRVLVRYGDTAWASGDAGRTWRRVEAGDRPTPAKRGDALRAVPVGGDCAGGRVEVWAPDAAPRGPLDRQPGLAACQVVPEGRGGDTWWAGGSADGWAAVAVTRDRGVTWRSRRLPMHGSARVAALGSHVYALVVGPDGRVAGVFHSADRGGTFTPTGFSGGLTGVTGDPVPLLDGRLLVVDPDGHWQVSADDGRTFRRAGGTLPVAGAVIRSRAGWVAYDLFHAGWTAFSADGATWRKLELY
jgi:hypothetical protein